MPVRRESFQVPLGHRHHTILHALRFGDLPLPWRRSLRLCGAYRRRLRARVSGPLLPRRHSSVRRAVRLHLAIRVDRMRGDATPISNIFTRKLKFSSVSGRLEYPIARLTE